MDLGRLSVLRTVIMQGSVRAAAASLDYTPSAVSQQLAVLQRETGLRLLERVGRGVEPTAAARTLVAESESLFRELGRLEDLVRDLRSGRTGSLSIGYFASAGAAWLPPLVTVLRKEFPDLRLDLCWTEMLDPPPVDLDLNVLVELPGEKLPPTLAVHPLIDDVYEVVVREDDPLAELDEVPLVRLAERAWIDNDLSHGACRKVLLDACAEAGFVPRFSVAMRDYRTAIPFVSSGIGITVIPELGIGTLPEGLVARPLVSPTPRRRISVAVRKAVQEHPAVVRTMGLLRETTSEPGALEHALMA